MFLIVWMSGFLMKSKLQCLVAYLGILSFSILVTIYLTWFLYPLEVSWLHLIDQVIISKDELLKNYGILLNYLTNPFVHELKMPDFSSSTSGLKHFADVKHLFHLVQIIFLVTIYPTIRFIRQKGHSLYLVFYRLAIVLPLVIGVFALFIGFDAFFTIFHQLLFVGDSSWLFNPATDPIIWVLPEDFFMHCFFLFTFFYEGTWIYLWWKGKRELSNDLHKLR